MRRAWQLGWKNQTLDTLCHVTGFMSDFLSFIVVELIQFFHGALQLWLCTVPLKWLSVICGTLQIYYFTLHHMHDLCHWCHYDVTAVPRWWTMQKPQYTLPASLTDDVFMYATADNIHLTDECYTEQVHISYCNLKGRCTVLVPLCAQNMTMKLKPKEHL